MAVSMIGPKFYAWNRDGKPLAFGKLYTYQARTNEPKATYQSEDQAVENTNPVILNGEGYANVYLDGSYKMVLKDSDDNEMWSSDPVTANQAEEWVNCQTAEYVSPKSFRVSGNLVDVFDKERRCRVNNNTLEYAYSSVESSSFAGGFTTVTITDSVVTTGIVSVCLSIVGKETLDYNTALVTATDSTTPRRLDDRFADNAQWFDTVEDMKDNAGLLADGMTAITRGYSLIGDGGGAEYLITNSFVGTPDGYGDHACTNGLVAVLSYSARELSVEQFGAVVSDVDVGPNIQAALDYFDGDCLIKGGTTRSYTVGQQLNLNGEGKHFDLRGASISFTHSGLGVLIGEQDTTNENMAFKNARIYMNDTPGTRGVQIVGKNMRGQTENLEIYRANGAGFEVYGVNNKTPFFWVHTNIRVQSCGVGIYLKANDPTNSADLVTTQTFISPVLTACVNEGISLIGTTSNTFISPSTEYCGTNVSLNYSARDYFFGGINEGASELTSISNSKTTGTFLMSPTAFVGGLSAEDWADLPPVYTSEQFVVKKLSMPIVTLSIGESIDLGASYRGKLSIQHRRGTYADILLSTDGGGSTYQATIIQQVFADGAFSFTTTEGTENKLNVYYNTSTSSWWIENNTITSQTLSWTILGE